VENAYKCILYGRDRHSLSLHHIRSERESERLAEGEARGSSVDSQRVEPVRGRGWGAGNVAGGPSQRGMCAFISRAPYSLLQPLGHGRRIFLRPVFSQCPDENMARATMAASMCF
jgi:hypothetical protein